MHSIRTKISALTLAGILISILLIGGIAIRSINQLGSEDSSREIRLISENRRQIINEYMNSIEQSVNMISHYAEEQLDSVKLVAGNVIGSDGYVLRSEPRPIDEGQRALNSYLHSYLAGVRTVFQTMANNTNGIITYYYRLNSQISRQEQGFFCTRVGSAAFTEIPVTDLYAYEENDVEHVGWYYKTLENGHPFWMGPYYNDNLGVEMFSYIVPIYRAGTFIGVIGMDIDYDTIVDQIDNLDIYQTGYACLTDAEGVIVYHPTLEAGINISNVDERLTTSIKSLENENSSDIIEYTVDGTPKKAAITTLVNGLKLIVTVPIAEINEIANSMTGKMILYGLLILLIAAAATTIIMMRIINPLRRLTIASKAMMKGNYNVELNYRSKDEIGILTSAFRHMKDHLELHISDLNSKAYKDALTSVRNKAGFDLSAKKINDQISHFREDDPVEFAVAMCDCNNLKYINDTYGHEKGDLYLKNACKVICDGFAHSPVFRLGGDEFVVILQGKDYENRDEILKEFERRQEEMEKSGNPWERVSISLGVAVFDPEKDSRIDQVLERADKLMYSQKRDFHSNEQAGTASNATFTAMNRPDGSKHTF